LQAGVALVAAQGLNHYLGLYVMLALGQGDQHQAELLQQFLARGAAQVGQERLGVPAFKERQQRPVKRQDAHLIGACDHGLRMVVEIRPEIGHARFPARLQLGLDGGKIGFQQGNRQVFEQAPVAPLAFLDGLLGLFALADVGDHADEQIHIPFRVRQRGDGGAAPEGAAVLALVLLLQNEAVASGADQRREGVGADIGLAGGRHRMEAQRVEFVQGVAEHIGPVLVGVHEAPLPVDQGDAGGGGVEDRLQAALTLGQAVAGAFLLGDVLVGAQHADDGAIRVA